MGRVREIERGRLIEGGRGWEQEKRRKRDGRKVMEGEGGKRRNENREKEAGRERKRKWVEGGTEEGNKWRKRWKVRRREMEE